MDEKIRELYRRITEKLIEKQQTVSTMESCTSGQVASLITDTEGASAVFPGGFVTYSNEAKIRAGVPESVIREHGVYSTECASAMAKACKDSFRTEIGIGVTGSFGNVDPNNADSVPGVVYCSIVTENGTFTGTLTGVSGSRSECKMQVAEALGKQLFRIVSGEKEETQGQGKKSTI